MQTFKLYISDSQRTLLDEESKATGLPIADLIRRAIDEHYADKQDERMKVLSGTSSEVDESVDDLIREQGFTPVRVYVNNEQRAFLSDKASAASTSFGEALRQCIARDMTASARVKPQQQVYEEKKGRKMR